MSTARELGPSPSGGGPAPSPSSLQAALDAAAQVAEERDLAVTMRDLGALVDAVAHILAVPARTKPAPAKDPSQSLLQSLIAEGWTVTYIASRMGMGQPELSGHIYRERHTAAMQARIRRVFFDLHGQDPHAAGLHRQGITRSQNFGAKKGWRILSDAEVAKLSERVVHAA